MRAGRLHRKRHENRIAGVILVFDLGLGQRGLLDNAPHHRLRAAIKQPVHGEFHQFARDLRLGGKVHGGVGVRPIADHAQPLEFLALHIEPVGRVGATFPAKGDHRRAVGKLRLGLALRAVVVFLDFPFDRQAVAIPARHVIGILAQHPLRARNEILEDLVQRMADVNGAVGVGRAIVQDKFRAALAGRAHLFVQADVVPAREDLRLLLRQAGAHGKIGLWQIQRGRIIGAFRRLVVHGGGDPKGRKGPLGPSSRRE